MDTLLVNGHQGKAVSALRRRLAEVLGADAAQFPGSPAATSSMRKPSRRCATGSPASG